jgi:hypothetical protein
LGELLCGDVCGARQCKSNQARQPCRRPQLCSALTDVLTGIQELNPVCETMWSGSRWRDVCKAKSTQIAEPDTASNTTISSRLIKQLVSEEGQEH